LERAAGAVSVVTGLTEAIAGASEAVIGAAIGVGAVPGVAAAVNGLDNAWAGLKTIWTGEGQDTYTQQAIGAGVERLTGSKTAAAIAETTVGILGPKGIIGLGQATGRVGRKLLEQAAERLAATKAAEQVAAEAAEAAAREAGDKASQVSGTIAAPPVVTEGEIHGPAAPPSAPISVAGSTASSNGTNISQVRINAQNGAEFQARVANYGKDTLEHFQEEVSVRPYMDADGNLASFRVRLDGLGLDSETENYGLLDAKSSETAPLTPNQTVGYPLISQYGGKVVGNAGNPYYPPGTEIPPTPVQIIKPNDLPEGY
jgi:hypothetical protein